MDKLSDLYAQIDRLNPDEFRQLRAYVEQHDKPPATAEDPQAKIAALRAATVDFWEGIPEAEIDEIVEEMNSEYVEPLSKSDWLDVEDEN
jgi:hypothetical protein